MKLAAALDHFRIDPAGCIPRYRRSTGGFAHVLATRGARRVVAVDVGRDQLHASLHGHPVIDSRRTNRRPDPTGGDLDEPPSLVTFDVSFIPLRLVLEPVLALAAPRARAVALIKPQFEAGRSELKKGIVRSPEARGGLRSGDGGICPPGWSVRGIIPSPSQAGTAIRSC